MARTEIRYDDYKVKAFLDTNIILEGRSLSDLPWEEIDADGPILALLTPTAIKEMDARKHDGRVGERARAFNRLIGPVAAGGAPVVIRESGPRVELALAHAVRIPWDQYDDLDPADGDSCIVAEALNAKDMNADGKLLVSNDLKPIIFASHYGLPTRHVSDSWLRQPGLHPKDQENQKLKNQVAEFERNQPEFKIKIELPDGEPVMVTRIADLTAAERECVEERIFAFNPKQDQSYHYSGLMAGFDNSNQSYDERFEAWRRRVPAYVANYEQHIERMFNQTRVKITVYNTGKVQAEHLLVEVRVSSGWIHNLYVPSSPRGPRPPKPPTNDFSAASLIRNIPRIRPLVARHEVSYKDEPERNSAFSVMCEDFRQGQEWTFEGVLGIDPRKPDTKIIVSVTAANFRGNPREVRTVERAESVVQVKEVVDLNSLRLIVDSVITQVIHSKDCKDIIDWEAFRDDN